MLTDWLDGVLAGASRTSGIPVEQLSSEIGGEAIAQVFEILSEMFAKGWFSTLIQFVTGLIATGYALLGERVPDRLRRELLEIGTHELFSVAEIVQDSQKLGEIKQSIAQAVEAVNRGDMDMLLRSMLKTPEELAVLAAELGLPVARAPEAVEEPEIEEFQPEQLEEMAEPEAPATETVSEEIDTEAFI